MPTVRVDAEVYAEIQRRALSFESPNNAIRRVLGLSPQGSKQGRTTEPTLGVQDGPSKSTTVTRPTIKRYEFTTHDLPGAEDEAVLQFADFLANHAAQSMGEDSGGYWATFTREDLLGSLSEFVETLEGDTAEEMVGASIRKWIEDLPYAGAYINLMIAY